MKKEEYTYFEVCIMAILLWK